jgi:hypothetical protein
MSERSGRPDFTTLQRAGLETRRVDQDRTLDAIHRLEAALGAAAPGRESDWLREVLAALTNLDEATVEEQHNASQADSLLSDIARTQPRLRNRVRGLRAQYRQVRGTIEMLRDELAATRPEVHPTDHADVRHRLAWLISALRHQRSRESDLIYEAYYDAFDVDIEAEREMSSAEPDARPRVGAARGGRPSPGE